MAQETEKPPTCNRQGRNLGGSGEGGTHNDNSSNPSSSLTDWPRRAQVASEAGQ